MGWWYVVRYGGIVRSDGVDGVLVEVWCWLGELINSSDKTDDVNWERGV